MTSENRNQTGNPSRVPEVLSKAYDSFYHDFNALKNLFETFRNAALWEEKGNDPDPYLPSWGMNFGYFVNASIASLAVAASEAVRACAGLAQANSKVEVAAASKALLDDVSKLHDLLAAFEVVAEDEDGGGNHPDVHWPANFQILLDIMARIDEGFDRLWDAILPESKKTE